MSKKVYITIESECPQQTLDSTLDNLQTERGVTYAEGKVGRGGKTQKRRYALEKLFSGVQPEDYEIRAERRAS